MWHGLSLAASPLPLADAIAALLSLLARPAVGRYLRAMPAASAAKDDRRAVLVTGAARRIGAVIARALAEAGWHVHLHHRESRREAAALAESIGRAVTLLEADFETLDEGQAAALIKTATNSGPPLAALVNNASLFEYDTLDSLSPRSWDRHMQVNLAAPILLTRAFARALPPSGPFENGCVVNLLDNKVTATNPDFFSYTISKQALAGATRTLALALAPRVRVCGVAPGIVLRSGKQTDAGFERAHRNNPLRRGAGPEDVARAVRFLLETPAITGQTIVIDGGQSLARPPRDVTFL